ncbi:hypothetical protein ACFL6N_00680 [Thermodesulfobacteriota bacterium]
MKVLSLSIIVGVIFFSGMSNAANASPVDVIIQANGSDTPITVGIGEPVTIFVSTVAGSDIRVPAEHWFGITSPFGMKWYTGKIWENTYVQPEMLFEKPIRDRDYSFVWTPKNPGVFMFQFVVDKLINQEFDAQFVDHVVITVLSD